MNSDEKPCLVPAGQGFSVLYKNRYLYSRYSPQTAAERAVEALTIRPQSLVLVFSPLLCYGLEALFKKIPDNSFVLFVEKEAALIDLTVQYLSPFLKAHTNSVLCTPDTIQDVVSLFDVSAGSIPLSCVRRTVPVELSSAYRLNEAFYTQITKIIDGGINQFWRNRITLIKLGRLYAKNLLRNLGRIPASRMLVPNSVESPFLICGAGPSLDTQIPFIKRFQNKLFIIAVDSALVPLLKNGIRPDAVLAVECQLANEKAFIGAVKSGVPIIADLTSRPQILSLTGGDVYFFVSEYEKTTFFNRVCDVAANVPVFEPLGSVGLSALEAALFLRKTDDVPVLFCGLDFAFVPCKTHCNESPAHTLMLASHNRLKPLLNADSSFRKDTVAVTGKNRTVCLTQPSLLGYGKNFEVHYAGKKNVFDISDFGIDTGCVKLTEQLAEKVLSSFNDKSSGGFARQPLHNNAIKIADFYRTEKDMLQKLRQMLVSGGDSAQILEIIKKCEYLYLHFPDGYKTPTDDLSFLKRVRGEIDFFLKDLEYGEKICKNR